MALETLKGVTQIGGFDVVVMDELREKFPEKFNESGAMDWQWFEKDVRPNNFIYLRHDKNSLSFTIQNGPINEVGVNGCQVDTIIEAAKMILEKFSEKHWCYENEFAIAELASCLRWLEIRRKNRVARGVEGTNQV